VREGRIRYHTDRVTVRVPITEALRTQVLEAIARAKALRTLTTRPPVTVEASKCAHCSLAPVCLPEEERLVDGATPEPGRLFPPHPDREIVHVNAQGARIRRAGEQLFIEAPDAEPHALPIHTVGAIVLHGNVQLTTQALHLCASREVGVHWLTLGGRYLGGLAAGPGTVQRRIRQYQALTDTARRLELARRLVAARLESQLRFLLRATRDDPVKRTAIGEELRVIRQQRVAVEQADSAETLRGYEGLAGRAYFAALPRLLGPEVPEALRPRGRSRRPPQDPFNAVLSFGYALLYRSVFAAVLAVGLEPAFGFFHTPRSAAHPLVLDLMELFRVPLWDMVVIASWNRRQWNRGADFVIARNHVWLSATGRRKAIDLYERRLADTWKHPVLQYSLSYARTIELEVRLLEKEWSGSPGVFARARLR
jgi:CRISPR-associated protein Cas1